MEVSPALIEAAQNGEAEASERLISENSGLIWSVARRYFGCGVEADDLYQLGCVGFLKAVAGFDRSYGTRFSTYAVPKISGEIRRFLRDDGTVKVSRGLKERAAAIRNARALLLQQLGREATLSELAAHTALRPEEIAAAELAAEPTQSLQYETGEDGYTLEEILGDDGQEETLVERLSLRESMDALPEKERQVVFLRYYHGMTQQAAARILGVSQVQVSRLERRAMDKMRALLSS